MARGVEEALADALNGLVLGLSVPESLSDVVLDKKECFRVLERTGVPEEALIQREDGVDVLRTVLELREDCVIVPFGSCLFSRFDDGAAVCGIRRAAQGGGGDLGEDRRYGATDGVIADCDLRGQLQCLSFDADADHSGAP